MNCINLIGRVGKDLELKYTNNSKAVTSFNIAVKDQYQKDKTDWFTCVAWNKTAETMVNYVTKGQEIGITGRLATRSYEDKQGNKRVSTEIIIDNFTFVGKKDDNVSSGSTFSDKAAGFEVVDEDDDLPF